VAKNSALLMAKKCVLLMAENSVLYITIYIITEKVKITNFFVPKLNLFDEFLFSHIAAPPNTAFQALPIAPVSFLAP
jgi:hypothetical protein